MFSSVLDLAKINKLKSLARKKGAFIGLGEKTAMRSVRENVSQ